MTEEKQLGLVKLSDQERIKIGKKAAVLAQQLQSTREEFTAVKKDYSAKIEDITHTLMETLRVLNEQ